MFVFGTYGKIIYIMLQRYFLMGNLYNQLYRHCCNYMLVVSI